MHPHANFEIFSYILSGKLQHNDSMGHEEVIGRGGVQFTSAGKGIFHSEYNGDKKEPVEFLQMWVRPTSKGLEPSYSTKFFTDAQKTNKLALIVSRDARNDSIKINADVDVYASILEPEKEVEFEVPAGRLAYLHNTLAGGKLAVNEEIQIKQGDGAYITGPVHLKIRSTANKAAEFVFFDLPAEEQEVSGEEDLSDDDS